MLSRKTANELASLLVRKFGGQQYSRYSYVFKLDVSGLYDWLYVNDYDAWFMNAAGALGVNNRRNLPVFIMRLHTGESVVAPQWSWEQRARLGQRLLENLCEDVLGGDLLKGDAEAGKALIASLELDGYAFRRGRLQHTDSAVFDTAETRSLIETEIAEAGLSNADVISHHLALSEQHYTSEKWDDSIANSRKALEAILEGVARLHHTRTAGALGKVDFDRPVAVRDYLERAKLLEPKEKHTVASVYGLLSETGGHPHIADRGEARLTRHMSLSIAEFVLLRVRDRR